MVTESEFFKCSGRVFQRQGAEWEKALNPMVVMRAGGMVSCCDEDDLRVRVGMLIWSRLVRY